MTEPPTSFAVLTPPGSAAVATIAVAGPRAWDIVRTAFRPATSRPLPAAPNADRFWYGQFGGPPGDAVIVSVRQVGHHSCVELHCHGGPQVVRMIGDELNRLGAVAGSRQAMLGISRLAYAAQTELSRAPTLRTAAILLDQCAGAFACAMDRIDAALAGSDFTGVAKLIGNLAAHSALGRHLTQPWRVAFAGAPNVGKSSLVNALAGYRRSVVTETPGTTRDVVVTSLAIDGWPVELIDTAGQHAAADTLEGQGIARGRAAAAAADLCLWVVDVTAEPAWPDIDAGHPLLVINKSDLPAGWDVGQIGEGVAVSARTGAGLAELCDRIGRRLVPDPPQSGAAVPFTPDLADQVDAIATAVAAGDIAAVRQALSTLASSAQPAPPG
jgi:tRNA modification GTPase